MLPNSELRSRRWPNLPTLSDSRDANFITTLQSFVAGGTGWHHTERANVSLMVDWLQIVLAGFGLF